MPEERPRAARFALRAFRSRNYRLWFGGQGISLIGSWMQSLAISWLVYRLTRSPLLLGLVNFAAQMPLILLTPFTGVLADRLNRYRLMIAIQVTEMALALALFGLVVSDLLSIPSLIALGVIQGAVLSLDSPARHAFVTQLVESRDDLPNAIALNSAMFNSARLIGPSLAGILVAAAGEAACFLVNAASFLAVIAALLAMRITPQPPAAGRRGFMAEFREGVEYVTHNRAIRLLMSHFAWVALVGMSFGVLLPVLAKETLHGGAHTLGFLMGAGGIGALGGALGLAAKRDSAGLMKLTALAAALFGTGLIGLAGVRHLLPALLLMTAVGLGMTAQMTTANTFIQLTVPDDKRARVLSFYLLAFFGTIPVGSLLIGGLAQALGASRALALSGTLSLCGTLLFAYRYAGGTRREFVARVVHGLRGGTGKGPDSAPGP